MELTILILSHSFQNGVPPLIVVDLGLDLSEILVVVDLFFVVSRFESDNLVLGVQELLVLGADFKFNRLNLALQFVQLLHQNALVVVAHQPLLPHEVDFLLDIVNRVESLVSAVVVQLDLVLYGSQLSDTAFEVLLLDFLLELEEVFLFLLDVFGEFLVHFGEVLETPSLDLKGTSGGIRPVVLAPATSRWNRVVSGSWRASHWPIGCEKELLDYLDRGIIIK